MGDIFQMGHALIIGVGADLPNTIDDAKGIADILLDSERCAYRASQVNLLTSENATRENILKALNKLAQVSDTNATVIVYFSGHGYQVSSQVGQHYYLMPYGYNTAKLTTTAISGAEFAQKLKSIPAKKLIVLLDCCHAGGVGESKALSIKYSKSPLPPEALDLLETGSGRVLIASSGEDEFSYAGKPYSAFTLALIEALCGFGVAKKDGYVRVADLALHTREVVPSRTNDKQHPVLHFEQADNFVLAYYASGNIKPKGLPFDIEPEIEPEPGAWTIINQRQITIQSPVQIGDIEIEGGFYQPGWNIHGDVTNINFQIGSKEVGEEQASVLVDRALVNHLDRMAKSMTVDTEKRLEEIRQAWREGRIEEVLKWLHEQKSNVDKWEALSPTVKAKVLKFEAGLELNLTRDITKAKSLADQAHELYPEDDDARLRALIAFRETGPDAAVEILKGKNDIDSINLRVAFLLEFGNIEECQRVLSNEHFTNLGLDPNAETHRLRALAYILNGTINQAQVEIQKAKIIAPDWESVRFTRAIVDYYSAVSPAALQNQFIQWPVPIPDELVKTDDESIARFQRASVTFHELGEMPGKPEAERQSLKVWQLACTINDSEKQDDATNQCKAILEKDPTEFRVIAWAIGRRLDVDLEPSKKALKKLVKDNSATIPHILALVNIYQSNRQAKGALYLLDRSRKLFQEQQVEEAWTFWHVQTLVLRGKPEDALKVIKESKFPEKLSPARIPALHAIAKRDNNWEPFIQELEQTYSETGDPNYLLDCCHIMAEQQNWRYVSEKAEELIREIATGEVLRIAAISAYNSGEIEFCLKLLNEHQGLYRQRNLPPTLKQLRISCMHRLGILLDAIFEAEENARENPSIDYLLTLVDLYFEKGDLSRVALIARDLYKRPTLSPMVCLRIARMLHWEDQELARDLWRQAVIDLPDSLIGDALYLGYQLGLDKEVPPIAMRVAALGAQGEGGIQIATLEDIKDLIAQQHDNETYLNDLYQKGEAPIHIIAERLGIPIANLYHLHLTNNEGQPNPLKQGYLLARHGGRALMQGFPDEQPNWRLNLDPTALLLAAHFEILTAIEQIYKPLRIPALTIHALIEMREKLTHHQPSRLESLEIIERLVNQDSIKVLNLDLSGRQLTEQLVDELGKEWIALFDHAQKEGGYILDYLPKQKQSHTDSPAKLPDGAEKVLINCRVIIDALRQQGPLSQNAYSTAIIELGDQGLKVESQEIPTNGSSIYCYGNTIEILASTGILDLICKRYKIFIGHNYFKQIQAGLATNQRLSETAEWLDKLRERISKGIDASIYEIIQAPFDVTGEQEEDYPTNPALGCLLTLMRFEYQEGDVIWIDDRSLNGYARRDAVPIIGINEILKVLVSAGVIRQDVYYGKLHNMRTANIRFIPIQANELLYHLQQARIDNNRLVETEELTILRQYLATCLIQGKILQRPPMPEGAQNQHGEVEFLLGLNRAIVGGVIEIWSSNDLTENQCRLYSEWLLNNLFVDHLSMSNLISWRRPKQDDLFLVAVSLSSFIGQAISITPEKREGISKRQLYFEWLYNRVLKPRLESNPNLAQTIAEILKNSVFTLEKTYPDETHRLTAMMVLQEFFKDLPASIGNAMDSDTEFMEQLGFQTVIQIGDLLFEPEIYWQAIAKALKGHQAKIRTLDKRNLITIWSCGTTNHPAICFKHPGSNENLQIQDDAFALLVDSVGDREEILRQNRQWFDCDDNTLSKIIAEIVTIERLDKRIEAVNIRRDRSIVLYYRRLYQELSKRQAFQLEVLLPPNAEALLQHYRLDLNTGINLDLQDALEIAAKVLIREGDLQSTLGRLFGLPVPLPKSLIETVLKLSAEEQRSLIKQLTSMACSPTARIHVIHLLILLSQHEPASRRLAKWTILRLLTEDEAEFDAFIMLLNWTYNEFRKWSEMKTWPIHLQLLMAWSHANQLFSIFKAVGAPSDWLRDLFSASRNQPTSDLFELDFGYWYEIAAPRYITRARFILSGLSYCLSENFEEIIDPSMQQILYEEITIEGNEQRVPDPTLLRDLSRAINSLDSFLGNNYDKLSSFVLDEEAANFIRSDSLHSLVEQAVNRLLESNNDLESWYYLNAALGGHPPHDHIREPLKSLLSQVDFLRLVEDDLGLGILAIHTASYQSIHFDDNNLREHLEEDIVNVAEFLYNQGQETSTHEETLSEQDRILGLLLDSALNLHLSSQSVDETIQGFCNTVEKLVDACPPAASVAKIIVQRMYEELPIPQAQQICSLLVQLRAQPLA